MLGVGLCVCLQWHSRRGHSEDKGVEVRGARCVLWEGDSGARYQVAFGSEVSSEGWAAQVGRLTGKIHLEPLQDGLKGQSWRREAGEEARRRPLLTGFSFPSRSVLISSRSSSLQSHFDSAPTPSP